MIVTDASVVFKWVKTQEPYYDKALKLLRSHLKEREKIIVPHLLFIEIANALATKTKNTKETIRKDLNYIFKANLEVYIPDNKDILNTANLAKEYKTSAYDMLYAVVAKKHKTKLITADANFINKTKFKFVKHLKDIDSHI